MIKTKKIIFFRHGETDWNKADLIQGITDISLNEVGRSQAAELAEKLKGEGLRHIFSSDRRRAIETAEIVSSACNAKFSIHPEMREIDFGIAEGKPRAEMRSQFSEMYKSLFAPDDPMSNHVCFPQGETRMQAFQRVSGKLYELIESQDADVLGVSTHGALIGAVLSVLFKNATPVGHCQAVEFIYSGQEKTLIQYKM